MDKRIGAQLYTIREFCKTLEDFDESCKKVSEMGYKVVQLSGIGDFSGNSGLELVEAFAKDFGPVCQKLAEHDLVFAYHNHGFEFVKRNGRYLFDELFDRMQYDNFKLILDVYWLASVGVNPA